MAISATYDPTIATYGETKETFDRTAETCIVAAA
jgi:hypothetical protein